MDNTIFTTTLNGIAQGISTLESYQDESGVNISNWIVQLVGNSSVEYNLTLELTLKDNKPIKVKIPKGFIPASVKSDSQGYVGMLRSGKVEKPDIEVFCLVGYFTASIILGKIPSIVNSGRGLILERMFKDLNVVDMNLTIHDFSSGGKDKPHPIDFTLPELKSLIRFFSLRSGRITNLPKKSGKSDRNSPRMVRDVEIIG